jgi:hypothetical protein
VMPKASLRGLRAHAPSVLLGESCEGLRLALDHPRALCR